MYRRRQSTLFSVSRVLLDAKNLLVALENRRFFVHMCYNVSVFAVVVTAKDNVLTHFSIWK